MDIENRNTKTEFKELRLREPASLWEMDRSRWEGHHSICQTIRDIYHLTDNEELKLKCRVAMAMTKAMNKKLQEYNQQTQEKTI